MSVSPVYRAAVIGCGRIGADESIYAKAFRPATHAGMLYVHKRIGMLALVDTHSDQRKKAERAFPHAMLFEDTKRMMEEVHPHIVSVAVPTHAHEATIKTIAPYRPLAILCEKPLALTIASAQRIVAICKKYDILLFVNHHRRFDKELVAVKKEIYKIAPITQGSVQYTRGIGNNGTHAIDLLRFYLGEVSMVWAIRNHKTEDWDDLKGDMNVDGMLVFQSGARIVLQSFRATDYWIFDMTLYGKEGKISLNQGGFRIERHMVKKEPGQQGWRELAYGNTRTTAVKRSMMRSVAVHIVDCVQGKVKPVSTGEDGLAALQVIEALRESARQGRKCIRIT